MKELVIVVAGWDNMKKPYSEISDSVVDRLLLRYLLFHVNRTRHNDPVPAHLVVGDRFLKSFDKLHHLFGIPALIYEPSHTTLCEQ